MKYNKLNKYLWISYLSITFFILFITFFALFVSDVTSFTNILSGNNIFFLSWSIAFYAFIIWFHLISYRFILVRKSSLNKLQKFLFIWVPLFIIYKNKELLTKNPLKINQPKIKFLWYATLLFTLWIILFLSVDLRPLLFSKYQPFMVSYFFVAFPGLISITIISLIEKFLSV
ncbi:hypothetical protein BCF59_0071 [Mycoplasmopsis mustelae]|uniref:DUF4328 domain-containing protein n=1 Tax=Mycoplasmopsis mustelae TaxID=171289 RepID=A0A4R7UER6_9BACT|nr:hypothetical protein BCF59_0071 [Mycoplasmopsis mustelae]